jgi:hypothetical protein
MTVSIIVLFVSSKRKSSHTFSFFVFVCLTCFSSVLGLSIPISQIPQRLNKEGGYDHREALFGMPPYGGSIAQQVYYADADLCDSNVDTRKGYPQKKGDDGQQLPWESPYILMVDRGGCTFVQKVRNAQRVGAAGVLIADNTCLCSDLDCKSKTGISTCENSEPIMADDGSGADISIPSFLMFKHDADPVKEELKANRVVQVEMAWALPTPDDRVEYDLWTTPSDIVTKDFFKNFKPLAQALGEHAYFTPHMYIHNGLKMGCQSSDGENFCYTLCTNNGRYCATDPDNDLDKGISGADVVKESLRRLCIWEAYGVSDGVGAPFWEYVEKFTTLCREKDPDYFSNEDCIKDAYKKAGIDAKKIENCMSASGGTTDDKINTKLSGEIINQEQRGVVVIPSTFVNNVVIRGSLTASNVFAAVCAGYSAGTTPDICKKCGSCANAADCVNLGYCKAGTTNGSAAGSGEGVSKHTFVSSMFMVIAVFGGLSVWHYKKTQDDMRNQVRGILADYLPLEDQDAMMHNNPMDFASGGISTSLMS